MSSLLYVYALLLFKHRGLYLKGTFSRFVNKKLYFVNHCL